MIELSSGEELDISGTLSFLKLNMDTFRKTRRCTKRVSSTGGAKKLARSSSRRLLLVESCNNGNLAMNSILICTNNLVPKRLISTVLHCAIRQAEDVGNTNVVVVSQYPVISQYLNAELSGSKSPEESKHSKLSSVILKEPFFDSMCDVCGDKAKFVNVVVGERAYAIDTIYRQLLLGTMYCGDKVAICEHDVFYPSGYLKRVFGVLDSGRDICFWESSIYLSYQGYFRMPNNGMFNRFSFCNEFLQKHLRDKISRENLCIEPALRGFSKTLQGEPEYGNYEVVEGVDILDIKHGFNTGGYFMVDDYMDEHSYWGNKHIYLDLIDDEYRQATQKNPSCFYGFNED